MKQKGAALRSTLIAIERLHGANAVVEVKAAVPERHRPALDGILAVKWYPIEVSAALHVAIREVLGGGHWRVSHRLGIEAARVDFTGIYRAMIRAVQYDTIWDRMERTWGSYLSQGNARWVDREPGGSEGRIEGVVGFNEGIWYAIAGRAEGMLLLTGAKSASVEPYEMTPSSARIHAVWVE